MVNANRLSKLDKLFFRLKHWEAFLIIFILEGIAGSIIYYLGKEYLGWKMSFVDSPAPAIPLYIVIALVYDRLLKLGKEKTAYRVVSILCFLFYAFAVFYTRLDNPPFYDIMFCLVFLVFILYVAFVLMPLARAFGRIKLHHDNSKLHFWVDFGLLALYFPVGLWYLHEELNKSIEASEKIGDNT